MLKVNEFLRKAKQIYAHAANKTCAIVIGNQSADLDSIASAISMSYYLTSQSQATTTTTYIPFINSTRAVIATKKECLFLFEQLAINFEQDLLFLSDWNPQKEVAELILVDHNELDEKQTSLDFQNLVTGIVDHHVDKGLFMQASPRIVDTSAGSNATLICDLMYKARLEFDSTFASLLLMPILSDTNNLTMRASQKDFEMVEYLQEIAQVDCAILYKKIEDLKFSSDQLEDTPVLLQKDYKQYAVNGKKWAMSSVTFCIQEFLQDETKLEDLFGFVEKNELFFYGLLSCFKDTSGQFKRDLWLVGNFREIFSLTDAKLTLVKKFEDKRLFCSLYDVAEVNLTRKYWQPVLETFLKSMQ